MKTTAAHVIKSVRIATARMGRPVEQPDARKHSSDVRLPPRAVAHGVGRRRRVGLGRKEWSQSTAASSQPTKRRRKRVRTNFSKKPSGSGSERESQLSDGPAADQCPSSVGISPTGAKRPAAPKVSFLGVDKLPFTETEMEAFEEAFGDQLFDNTIDTGPGCQADLEVLGQRRFRSYKRQAAGVMADRTRDELGAILQRARQRLEVHGQLTVRDSQLVRLLTFFSSEKGFLEFLRLEAEALVNYFERTKLYPRRKVFK